jgi:hypothetical protein
MTDMRTTLSIPDDLLRDLRALARSQKSTLTDAANKVLRAGLAALDEPDRRRSRFREQPTDLGAPTIDLTKALSLAAQLEDEEVVRKLQLRK